MSDGAEILGNRQFASTLDSGTELDGQYIVHGKLGGGGMGQVFVARQMPIDRRVAIKILHPRYVSDEEIRARFLREARAASQLSHPNTITFYDFGYAGDDLHYIAMEYVEGESLADLLEQEGSLAVDRAASIIIQVVQSLGEAHRKGIIHRDLKPDNILIENVGQQNERVKVLDFGIAKLTDHSHGLTDTGSVFGTPGYMAPEQAKGREVDHTCDFYGLTCCLYECLTGEVPFSGTSALEIMMNHQTEKVPAIGEKFPNELDNFVQYGMAKEPSNRPQSADEYVAAFMASFVDDEDLETSDKSSGRRERSTQSRLPAMSAGEKMTNTTSQIHTPIASDEHPDYDTGEEFGIEEMEVVTTADDELGEALGEKERAVEHGREIAGGRESGQHSSVASEARAGNSGETVANPEATPSNDGGSGIPSPDNIAGAAEGNSSRDGASEKTGRSPDTQGSNGAGTDGEQAAEDGSSPGESFNVESSRGEASKPGDPTGRGSRPAYSSSSSPSWAQAGAIGLVCAALAAGGVYLFVSKGEGDKRESAGAKAEATEQVTVEVASEPTEARVVLGGQTVGETPMELEVSSERRFTLELKTEGYKPHRLDPMTVEDAPSGRLFASLDRKTLTLDIRSPVPRAELTIDGTEFGMLPEGTTRTVEIDWPTSTMTVKLAAPGYAPLLKRFPPPTLEERIEIAPSESAFVSSRPDTSTSEND